MTTATAPDLFTNVHKGIRAALFAACRALGADEPTGRDLLRDALAFIAHHGDNEDALLLPQLASRAPELAARLAADHAALDAERATLAAAETAHYTGACELTAHYLAHLAAEEQLEPAIRAALSLDEIVAFGRDSVARTAPDDARMMLGWILPAMPRPEAHAFLARLPAPLAAELRARLDAPASRP